VRSRAFLLALLAAATLAGTQAQGGSTAARCPATPDDGAGPFGRGEPPVRSKIGTGHVLTGVVLSVLDCRPIRNARVQFWQSDRRGRYTNAGSGTVVADRLGRFRFEGPFPASYEGRSPHIHIRVHAAGHLPLFTRYAPRQGARAGRVRLVLRPEDV